VRRILSSAAPDVNVAPFAAPGGSPVLIIALIAIYVLGQIAIAAWAGRGASNDADYLVAGRKLGVFAVAMSLFATWFASESVVATSAEVAAQGLAGARVEPLACGAGILFLGLGFAAALRRGGHMTLADYFRARFGPATEMLSAGVIALSGMVWAAAQLFALAAIIASSGGFGFHLALFAAAAIVLTYTLLGGLMGDVVTDIIQGAILLAGLLILVVLVVAAADGPAAAIAAAPRERLSFSVPGETLLDRLEIWLVPIFASIAAQEAISRTLAARTPDIARAGAILGAGFYMAAGVLPVAFGLIGPHLGIPLGEGDEFLPSLAETLFPPWMYIVFTGALLSAILSSVDSALLAVSAVATETAYKRARPGASPRETLAAARLATLVAGLLAFGVAASGQSLREIVLTSAAIGGVLAAPLVMSLVTGLAGRHAAPAAIGVQIVMLAALDWVFKVPGAFVFTILAGFAVYIAVALIEEAGGRTARDTA